MRRQLSASAAFVLLLSTSAWAQLASQTALVGTVTDSAGAVVPGANVVAVNVGTADKYEATTNAEGYYNIQFAQARPLRDHRQPIRILDLQGHGHRGRYQPGGAHERRAAGGRDHRDRDRRGQGPGARHRPPHRLGDHQRARRRRAAPDRTQRLEPGRHHAGRPGRAQQRHRPQLPRRRTARDPEQPVPRRHQLDRPTCWPRRACGRSRTR